MANFNVTPNMQLPNPVPGVDPGPDYADNIESSLNIVDQHNHSAGQGVLIQPNGLNISSDLPFNGNNAVTLRTVRFISQASPIPNTAPDVGCLYVSGNELWYNDYTGGNQVQITTNGLINATSSGISSGTATATFSAGTLVVKSSSTSFANVDLQSVVLSNAGNITNQLTLLAPTLSSSYDLTLPLAPLVTSIMALDSAGNMSAPYTVDNSTIVIASNVIKVQAQGITATQIANNTITRNQEAAVGQQISSGCGSFRTTSTSPVGVTNLSITITTTGRPVIVGLYADPSVAGSQQSSLGDSGGVLLIYVLRDATTIGQYRVQPDAGTVGYPGFTIDVPTSGSHTYAIEAASLTGSNVSVNSYVLGVYEL